MVDIGMNESLEVRESPEGSYFVLWPFGPGPHWGHAYQVKTESKGGRFRVYAPAMPGFTGEGTTPREAEDNLIAAIKIYLYRVKHFLDTAQPLIFRYLAPDSEQSGEASVHVDPEGISVWAIIASMKASSTAEDRPGEFDRFIDDTIIRQTAVDYGVPIDAVRAAAAYYYGHRGAIDARIQANNPAA
jgi:hypothetical protein